MRLILRLLSLSKLYKQAMAIAIPESQDSEASNPLYINHPHPGSIETRIAIHGQSIGDPVQLLDIHICILHTESSTEREKQWPASLKRFVEDSFCSREAFLGVFN